MGLKDGEIDVKCAGCNSFTAANLTTRDNYFDSNLQWYGHMMYHGFQTALLNGVDAGINSRARCNAAMNRYNMPNQSSPST